MRHKGTRATRDWGSTGVDALLSGTAKRLAETLVTMHAHTWWRALLDQP